MPRIRRYLPPLLLLLPVIFICGKLMFSTGTDEHDVRRALFPAELLERVSHPNTETRGWPCVFQRTFSDFDFETENSTELATRYYIFGFLADALIWALPILIAAWLIVRHRRRTGAWFRFSLRALLVFVCVVGMALGLFLKEFRQRQREKRVTEKYDLFCTNSYDCPEWLRRLWLGNDGPAFLDHPTELDLTFSDGYTQAETRSKKIAIAREALVELPDLEGLQTDTFILPELCDSIVFSRLKSLDLTIPEEDTKRAPELLKLVSRWTQLTELKIRGYRVSDDDLADLGKLTNLETLWFDLDSQVSDAGVAHLANLSQLDALDLDHGKITDRSLPTIAGLSSLERISLMFRRHVTNAGLSKLAGTTNLTKINLRGTGVTPGVTKYLAGNTYLGDIDLSDTKIDDSEFEHLAKFPYLNRIRLEGTPIKGLGFDQIASLKYLGSIDFSKTEIGDDVLQALGRCESLKYLRLVECRRITDEGIVHLVQLQSLKYLDLTDTPISDRALESISKLPSLESLDIRGCTAVTDNGVRKLARAAKLRTLYLDANSHFSNATVLFLRQTIANVKLE